MPLPLVSVIVPAYNTELFLSRTLESILNQTYSNLEIIVVNDGSTDGTALVLDSFAQKDSRIKAVHKENGGVTSARLRGVQEASGEWIGFVDGDDYIEPKMYEKLLDNALEYGADISHCGYQMVFHNRVDYYYNTGRIVHQDKTAGLADLLSGQFIEPGLWNKLFHRSLFDSLTGKMDYSIKINEDLLMNYWLFKNADRAVYEDICPYHYIVRKGSAANSGISEHKLWDPLRVTRIILDDTTDAIRSVIFQRYVRILVQGASMSAQENPQLITPYRSQMRKELRQHLGEILWGSACGMKLKIMGLWASVWPASYGWVHRMYEKVSGLDKIYDLD